MTVETGKKWTVAAMRLLVGATFILSGLAKSIDLWGTVYKISDYLAVWQIDMPYAIIWTCAAILAWGEFILGALCFLGCYRRSVPIILAVVMAVMLPFSLYIWIADPVADCGCFGDMIVLSNAATFWKNVLIVAMLVPLVMWNRMLVAYIHPAMQWLAGAVVSMFIIFIGLRGYNVQPIADFRSFPIGTNMAMMAEEDDVDYEFVYADTEGNTKAFSIDALPDSTWTFVERRVVAGSETTKDRFAVFGPDGEDVTTETFPSQGDALVVTVPNPMVITPADTYKINELYRYLQPKGIPLTVILPPNSAAIAYWEDIAMPDYPIYTADVLQIKELVRGKIGLVWLSDGVILRKTSLRSLPDPLDFVKDEN